MTASIEVPVSQLFVDQPCLPETVARLQALMCLCICGEVPRCTRRGLWPTCTALQMKVNSRGGGLLMLLRFPMTCISSWRSCALRGCE
ncbi:unnamed protein product [Prunus armeniaca]